MTWAALGVTPSVRHNDAAGSASSSAALIFALRATTCETWFSIMVERISHANS